MGGVVSYEDFLDGDPAIIDRCDAVVLLPNWLDSKGATRERAYALNRGIPVFEWPQQRDYLAEFSRPLDQRPREMV